MELEKINTEVTSKLWMISVSLLEVFLFDFMEMKGISEEDLHSELQIIRYSESTSVGIIPREEPTSPLLMQEVHLEDAPYIEVSGSVLNELDSYPRTKEFLGIYNQFKISKQ